MDPDPAIFVCDLQDKLFCFFAYYLLFEGTFTPFFKDRKSHKEVTKQLESMFFFLFLLDA
jgi:hypothetical protein